MALVTEEGNIMTEQNNSVSLSGYLPAEEHNGIAAHLDVLTKVKKPTDMIVIGLVERTKREVSDNDGSVKASVRITHVEVADGPLADTLREHLAALQAERTGEAQLDLTGGKPDATVTSITGDDA